MNRNRSLPRKIVYLSLIVALLIPLHQLGQPASGGGNRDGADAAAGSGGELARMRIEHGLAQSTLGDIDPASESMKLATLGLRGPAANLLWTKSIEYKKKEQWDRLSATLNQITKLQPNFYKVWEYQAHNLSYNVSVEFDDYRYRYHWVKKGIDFLMKGTHANHKEPRLFYKLGWFMGQKIGRADEADLFRELFRDDEDFHDLMFERVKVDATDPLCAPPPRNKPDNWLVGERFYEHSYDIIDGGVPLRGHTPHLFFHSGAMSLMNYAVAVGKEGWFDMALVGWERGEKAYRDYGNRDFTTSWGTTIKLNNRDQYLEEAEKLARKLDEMAPPGLRERLRQEKIDKLTDEERAVLGKSFVLLTNAELDLRERAEAKTDVRQDEVALQVDRSRRAEAQRIARTAMLLEARSLHAQRYRDQANYDYWMARCQAEQRPEARQARELMHDADESKDEARLTEARKLYEEAWEHWARLYEDYPILLNDPSSSDVTDAVGRYLALLELEGVDVPDDFKLVQLLRFHQDDLLLPTKFRGQIEKLIQRDDAKRRAEIEAEAGRDQKQPSTEERQPSEGDESSPPEA